MKEPYAFASIFSRNPLTGEKKIETTIYEFASERTHSFTDLPEETQKRLEEALKSNEEELGFVAQIVLVFSEDFKNFEVKLTKKAKVATSIYPKLLVDLQEEGIIDNKRLFQDLPLDLPPVWFVSKIGNTSGARVLIQTEKLSPGANSGVILHTRDEVVKALIEGESPVWVIDEVSAEDLKLFDKVSGIVLTNSGTTSHAAVVAKAVGIPAVLGGEVLLDKVYKNRLVTIDGSSGKIYEGKIEIERNVEDINLQKLLVMAQKTSKIKVKANADKGEDYAKSIKLFAKGIGLCRTEHMFTDEERANQIRLILLSEKPDTSNLQKLQDLQEMDFTSIFEQNDGELIVIRYLDAPLHEFLPKGKKEKDSLARELKINEGEMDILVKKWTESNPMLGLRGARMLMIKPEIIELQTKAIINAANKFVSNTQKEINIGLEIPLVVGLEETETFINSVKKVMADLVIDEKVKVSFGAMIETPMAIENIESIAKKVDFIAYGTNDLVQTYFGLSRDDSGSFLDYYIEKRLIKNNPFVSLANSNLDKIIIDASKRAHKSNPNLIIGLCGEQAGDPMTIEKLVGSNIDYLSVSPARIPLTYFAAAKYSV